MKILRIKFMSFIMRVFMWISRPIPSYEYKTFDYSFFRNGNDNSKH